MRIFNAAFIGLLFLVSVSAGSGNSAVLATQNDREFAEVITAIANKRKVDRSTAIDVTPFFKPMTDRLSLTELKDYVLGRYSGNRGMSLGIRFDRVEIEERELKSFDRAFLYKDGLAITFGYSDDWKTVTIFKAVLLNDQL
jgi:hypothetical protein